MVLSWGELESRVDPVNVVGYMDDDSAVCIQHAGSFRRQAGVTAIFDHSNVTADCDLCGRRFSEQKTFDPLPVPVYGKGYHRIQEAVTGSTGGS